MYNNIFEIISKDTENIPQQVQLNLPKLQKVSSTNTAPKLKLPKLQKA